MSIHKIADGLAVTILCGMLTACASKSTVYDGGKFVNIVNKSGNNLISITTMTKKIIMIDFYIFITTKTAPRLL